jgi:hypothetical protein
MTPNNALQRTLGFKGSFPHLYRQIGGHVDLLNFQFYSAGSAPQLRAKSYSVLFSE